MSRTRAAHPTAHSIASDRHGLVLVLDHESEEDFVQLVDGAIASGIPDVRAEPTHLASVTRLREVRRDEHEVRAYQAIEQSATATRLPRGRPDVTALRQWLGARHRSVELVGERAVVFDRLTGAYLEPQTGDWIVDVPATGVIVLGNREFLTLFQPAIDVP